MKNKVVSREEWLKASADFLKKEKAFTHERDALARQRRELPWMLIDKNYTFDTPTGKKTLSDLFQGKSQLLVQHFMLGPGWKEGCPGCSFMGDHVDGALRHLNQRDVTFTAISRGALSEIEAFKKRMGWKFNWVSSASSDFNFDFNVSFSDADKEKGKVTYNFETTDYQGEEMPGVSAFYKDASGRIFRTYSSYARGCEMVIGAYMLLDLLPKGRDEEPFKFHPMEWVKLHDQYDNPAPKHSCH
jgi:predicted dithiol-disulfide oxidoreductase (DUF899 family)